MDSAPCLYSLLPTPHRKPLGMINENLAACGILVPPPGITPVPHAEAAQRLSHWTTREVPPTLFLKFKAFSFSP